MGSFEKKRTVASPVSAFRLLNRIQLLLDVQGFTCPKVSIFHSGSPQPLFLIFCIRLPRQKMVYMCESMIYIYIHIILKSVWQCVKTHRRNGSIFQVTEKFSTHLDDSEIRSKRFKVVHVSSEMCKQPRFKYIVIHYIVKFYTIKKESHEKHTQQMVNTENHTIFNYINKIEPI